MVGPGYQWNEFSLKWGQFTEQRRGAHDAGDAGGAGLRPRRGRPQHQGPHPGQPPGPHPRVRRRHRPGPRPRRHRLGRPGLLGHPDGRAHRPRHLRHRHPRHRRHPPPPRPPRPLRPGPRGLRGLDRDARGGHRDRPAHPGGPSPAPGSTTSPASSPTSAPPTPTSPRSSPPATPDGCGPCPACAPPSRTGRSSPASCSTSPGGGCAPSGPPATRPAMSASIWRSAIRPVSRATGGSSPGTTCCPGSARTSGCTRTRTTPR